VFDSDGSFSIVRHLRKGSTKEFSSRVLLQITWGDIPETVGVFEDLQRVYSGSVIRGIENSGHSKHTHYVRYRIDAKQARRLIADILPYLRIKRRKAELCLQAALIISRSNHGRWNPRPREEWEELERLCS
jgi:hypothetical protein